MISAITAKYDWILALVSIAFVASAFGNGANDVANAYATSVAARTLQMWQAGILAVCTEFVGAVALGDRVTDTIKDGIIDIARFEGKPGAFMLAMGCAEFGSAGWLTIANMMGWPVSTTQTIVGALIGAGLASQANIHWEWTDGGVAQIAASWGIAPGIAAGFSAIIFGIVKYTVLERKDPFKWAMRLIPVYLAFTGAILALFIVMEVPSAPFENFTPGTGVGIMLGVFFGCLFVGIVFFLPYFHRRLVMEDTRVKAYHLPLGPLLLMNNCPLYFPAKSDVVVVDYYEDPYSGGVLPRGNDVPSGGDGAQTEESKNSSGPKTMPETTDIERNLDSLQSSPELKPKKKQLEPEERWLDPVRHLPWYSPDKFLGYTKYCLLQGVTRNVVGHDSERLHAIHARASQYDVRVEHLWTYCQVVSAMMMSIAHGSNDVANAVGPWVAVYSTYKAGEVDTEAPTPVWFLVIAGLLLGIGFWCFGFNIVRALGNKITRMSPTRGFAIELGAAITVLLASHFGLPVSTTQCLTGASMGVALMNYDLGAVNWRQLAFIFGGWVLTLPCAGLMSGLLCLMALNTPHL